MIILGSTVQTAVLVILRRMSSGDSREIVVTSAVRTPTGKSNLYDHWGQNLETMHSSEPFLLIGISLNLFQSTNSSIRNVS